MIRRSKVRAGTATYAVLQILNVPRHFPWLTMQRFCNEPRHDTHRRNGRPPRV
jgi:hypothetical protein